MRALLVITVTLTPRCVPNLPAPARHLLRAWQHGAGALTTRRVGKYASRTLNQEGRYEEDSSDCGDRCDGERRSRIRGDPDVGCGWGTHGVQGPDRHGGQGDRRDDQRFSATRPSASAPAPLGCNRGGTVTADGAAQHVRGLEHRQAGERHGGGAGRIARYAGAADRRRRTPTSRRSSSSPRRTSATLFPSDQVTAGEMLTSLKGLMAERRAAREVRIVTTCADAAEAVRLDPAVRARSLAADPRPRTGGDHRHRPARAPLPSAPVASAHRLRQQAPTERRAAADPAYLAELIAQADALRPRERPAVAGRSSTTSRASSGGRRARSIRHRSSSPPTAAPTRAPSCTPRWRASSTPPRR